LAFGKQTMGKEKLIIIRSRIEDKVNFRNVIGMGPLLKDIADIEKVVQNQPAPVKPATTPRTTVKPAPAKPAPVATPQPVAEPEVDNTEYAYSESIRPKRGISETKRQRR